MRLHPTEGCCASRQVPKRLVRPFRSQSLLLTSLSLCIAHVLVKHRAIATRIATRFLRVRACIVSLQYINLTGLARLYFPKIAVGILSNRLCPPFAVRPIPIRPFSARHPGTTRCSSSQFSCVHLSVKLIDLRSRRCAPQLPPRVRVAVRSPLRYDLRQHNRKKTVRTKRKQVRLPP